MLDTSSPVPLDFLANGKFLRTSIEEYLASEGLSSETTLTLQYVRSLIPPVYQASFEHDDWVSGVDVMGQRAVSSSYDGVIRVWTPSGESIAAGGKSEGGHSRRADCVKWLSEKQLVSAGLDFKMVVWDYSEGEDGSSGKLKASMELYGHEKKWNSIAVHGSSGRILSASSDGKIGLWSSSKRTAPQADPQHLPSTYSNKKTKISEAANTAQRGPLTMISVTDDPYDPVTAAMFHPHDSTVAYTASADHTVKTIDLTTQKEVNRLTTMHPITCASALPNSLIAAGTSARHITLLDPRESAAATAAMTLRGHVNRVSSIAPCPENDYSLVSGSWDSTCRVWDLRSVRSGLADGDAAGGRVSDPAYTIPREWLRGKKLPPGGDGAKVLSVAWDREWGIVSGGEDKNVQINKGRGLLEE